MPTDYFGPLPENDSNFDQLLIWLGQQTISFQKIIAGSLQVGQDLVVSGTITLGPSGIFRTAASGERIEISEADNDRISWYSGLGLETSAAYIEVLPSPFAATYPALHIHGPNDPTTTRIQFNASGVLAERVLLFEGHDAIQMGAGATTAGQIILTDAELSDLGATTGEFFIKLSSAGTASLPTYSFVGDVNTGMFRQAADSLGLAAGAEEKVRIIDSGDAAIFDMIVRRGTTFVAFEVGATDSAGSGFRTVRVPN